MPKLTNVFFLFIAIVFFGKKLSLNINNTLFVHSKPQNYAQAAKPYPYPYQASQLLNQLPTPQNILNYYDWGGYLIWQSPNHKTFIDGRMDNFFVEDQSFLTIYQNLVNADLNWQQQLKKYQVTAILLPPHLPLTKAAISSNWQILFQDKNSILLTKPK